MDISNFIDYYITEIFFVNLDWPSNNITFWRPLNENGKWRWILYDLDAGYGYSDYNMLSHCTNDKPITSGANPPWATLLFRKLLENESFKLQFIKRYAEILNNDFRTERMLQKMDSIINLYKNDIPEHIKRWKFPDSYDKWENDIYDYTTLFLEYRPCNVEKNIKDFFNLDAFDFTCLIPTDTLKTSDLHLFPNPNKGYFVLFNNTSKDIEGDIHIFDITGKIIYNEKEIFIEHKTKKYFNLNNLVKGIYFLQLINKPNTKTFKFIIVK